ncbi:hypothetical protein EPR50_G00065340 [Perca flavescens]|uniref:Uncharacterized protein n=1 Tax=Perca flavescens TaxID=8167 RepID=A0A484D9G1_PERFV|nr:hypothetical protein EPR50_G00065340 [Perca flavescens]
MRKFRKPPPKSIFCSLGGGDTLLVSPAEEQIASWPGGEVTAAWLSLLCAVQDKEEAFGSPLPGKGSLQTGESKEEGRSGAATAPGSRRGQSGTKERLRKRSPRKHVSNTHICTQTHIHREAGIILGHALQAVAVERLIPADIVEEVDRSEMIPHEVYGAHFVSWSDTIFSGVRPGAVYQ